MKILITGNLGYIGPVVIRQLRNSYDKVTLIGFDANYFSECLIIKEQSLPDFQYFGDIRSFPVDLLKEVDSIIHLAAISNDPIGNMNEEVTLDINYRATVELAKKAKQLGVKSFVFASSCSVYGFAEDEFRSELSSLNPLTAYARSKVLAEKGLEKIANENFKITCLRFATACGMSERLRLDLVLNDFVASAVTSGKIELLSDGMPWRPLIDIHDIALAINWAIDRKVESGRYFLIVNVGSSDWNYRIKDLAEAVSNVVGNVEISINKNALPDKRSYKVDFKLFKSLASTEYQPKYNLIKTITELKDGLNAVSFRDTNFHNSNLIRLRSLENLRKKGMLTNDFRWVEDEIL